MSLDAQPLTALVRPPQWLLTVNDRPLLLVRVEPAIAKLYGPNPRPLWLVTHVDPGWHSDGSICSVMIREGDPVMPAVVGEALDMADPIAIPVAQALNEFINEFAR